MSNAAVATKSASLPVSNGVNTQALIGARSAFEQTPQAAQCCWRSESGHCGYLHRHRHRGQTVSVATAQTAEPDLFTDTEGLTSLLVISAALGTLTLAVLASAWHLAVPIISLLPAIVSTLT